MKNAIVIALYLAVLTGCSEKKISANIEFIDPDGLVKAPMFHQVAISTGTATIHVAGQTAMDAELNIIGKGDFKAQTAKAWEHVAIALKAAGTSMDNIVSSHVFVVGLKPEMVRDLMEVMADSSVPAHAFSTIGVEALAAPGLLIEISAVAVK